MKCLRLFLLFIVLVDTAYAEEIQIVGNIEQSIKSNAIWLKKSAKNKSISLLKLHLSPQAEHAVQQRVTNVIAQIDKQSHVNLPKPLPEEVQLGMNDLPVFDQGGHGTCVTFAATAAIDAALKKGDYISQVCSLVLGRYLQNNSYTVSGWDGAWIHTYLNQVELFGVVSKKQQRENGCGGLYEYPIFGDEPTAEISLSDYHQLSEEIPQDLITWTSLLEPYQVAFDQVNMNSILNNVKIALNSGDRVVLGVMLLDFERGVVGAVGKHNAPYDTWVLTPEIAADLGNDSNLAGHALTITGYDDNATVIDEQGRVYHGLLTLRNSWGNSVGDKGDFYMTYDYFKALALEVQRIRLLK